MFKTNGSTHHQGVSNEHATIDILNEFAVYDTKVKHRGGTKFKADAVAGEKGISIKHKAGLKNGSFDWVNTSDINAVIDRTALKTSSHSLRVLISYLKKIVSNLLTKQETSSTSVVRKR